MKTIVLEKSEWEHGEWDNEPDSEEWIDEETGYRCLIWRNFAGGLCGYVGINKNHPYFGLDYRYVELNVSCHGGITFSSHMDAQDIWWIGFDCVHAGDKVPLKILSVIGENYRNIDYVKKEIKSVALQLKELCSTRKRILFYLLQVRVFLLSCWARFTRTRS